MASDSRKLLGTDLRLSPLIDHSLWVACRRLVIQRLGAKAGTLISAVSALACLSKIRIGQGANAAPPSTNELRFVVLAPLLVTLAACGRTEAPNQSADRIQAAPIAALPASESSGAPAPSVEQLDRALRHGMTRSEAAAAIRGQGTTCRFASAHLIITSMISDDYPGMAIDLHFVIDDDITPRLSRWELRKREPTEFYLMIRDGAVVP